MMTEEYITSASGADIPMDISFLAQLGGLDLAFSRNPSDMGAVQRALAFLEENRRQDLQHLWARRAQTINPDHQLSIFAMASSYDLDGRFDRSIPLWREMQRRFPNVDPLGLNLANALASHGELVEAMQMGNAALAILDQRINVTVKLWTYQQYTLLFHLLMAEILLRQGEPRGFAHLYAQTAVRVTSFVVPGVPVWDGRNIAGLPMLITPAGGYGDQLLFASVLPSFQRAGAVVRLAVHPDLMPLAQASLPGCDVIASAMPQAILEPASPELMSDAATHPPGVQMNMFQLPVLRAQTRLPGEAYFPSYLKLTSAMQQQARVFTGQLRAASSGKKIIGITWDRAQRYYPDAVGGVEACRTARTSLPLATLGALIEDPLIAEHFHFAALHETKANRNWPRPMPANLSRLPIEPGDFSATAAAVAACEFILSIDMSVANLAAMLGKTTWLMLAHEGDWRWGHRSETSPWISGIRCFRQAAPGDWDSVKDAVKIALAKAYQTGSLSQV